MMREASYGISKQLTVGTPINEFINDLPVAGLCAVCTVAGNATITLSGGSQMTISLGVGTVVLPLGAINVNSQTATATYYALA